jgi:class 3 adenylate cyclase
LQGSTELWEWDQQLASDAFKTHDRVLRQYMTQFFGYEVSTEGDAFLVAFHEPFDAVAWCLCVQLALHCEFWHCFSSFCSAFSQTPGCW